jgi:hypothetical protein
LSIGACAKKSSDNDYLIRVGSSSVTVAEFNRDVESAGEEAFAGESDVKPSELNDLRARVLNQITEELIILEKAKALGVTLSDEELEKAINTIKADYPDNTFEETLLENAVSFAEWKKKLATRLLTEKVITGELVDKVQITTEDMAAYYQSHYPQGVPEGSDDTELNKRIVTHLRQQKAEAEYKEWIETLRHQYPVDLNQKQWDRIVKADDGKKG